MRLGWVGLGWVVFLPFLVDITLLLKCDRWNFEFDYIEFSCYFKLQSCLVVSSIEWFGLGLDHSYHYLVQFGTLMGGIISPDMSETTVSHESLET